MTKSIPGTVGRGRNVPIRDACTRCNLPFVPSELYIRYHIEGKEYNATLDVDVLLDIIQVAGIEKGGRIPCRLIWVATAGGNHRLVRVGSSEYNETIRKDNMRALPKIKIQNLEVGGVYRSLSSAGIYLGRVSSICLATLGPVVCVEEIKRNRMLWIEWEEALSLDFSSLDKLLDTLDLDKELFAGILKVRRYFIDLKQTHSYREKITEVETAAEGAIETLTNRLIAFLQRRPRDTYDLYRLKEVWGLTVGKGDPVISNEVKQLIEEVAGAFLSPSTTLEELPEYLAHADPLVREYAKIAEEYLSQGKPVPLAWELSSAFSAR